MNPSLEDVAQAAGVHRTTVSRALKNSPRLPENTRLKLQALAKHMGYRPNALVSALMTKRAGGRVRAETDTIAFLKLVPDDRWNNVLVFQHYEKAARQRAEERGYRLELFSPSSQGLTLRHLQKILKARGIMGICLSPMPRHYSHLKLEWEEFAPAIIGRSLLAPKLHRSVSDHYQGMMLALKRLQRLGYRRIGYYVHPNTNKRVEDLWLAAFLTFQHRHPRLRCLLREHPGLPGESPLAWIKKAKPEVVIGDSPNLQGELERAGFKLPDDLGFCTLTWSEEHGHQAGIDQRDDTVAAAAIDLVVAQLQHNERGVPEQSRTMLMPGEWKDGTTVRNLVETGKSDPLHV